MPFPLQKPFSQLNIPLADWMGINFQWGFKGSPRIFMSVGALKNFTCLLIVR